MQKMKLFIVAMFLTYSTFLLASDFIENFEKKATKSDITKTQK